MSNLLILGSTSGTVRTDKRDGKTYTVVPIVALVEGVIHAMNAKGPELVRAATYEPTPPLWNGRPVFLGHPLNEQGRPVSGSIPHVAKRSIGMVYNCDVKDDKLCMEAWLDERAPKELLDRVNSGEAVEVSVGVFVDTDETTGNHGGRDYQGEWHNMVPDHLAILPAGDIGACSWAAGCGVRAASLRLEDAIGNGNNQYTHGQAATAHEKAQAAHEAAAAAKEDPGGKLASHAAKLSEKADAMSKGVEKQANADSARAVGAAHAAVESVRTNRGDPVEHHGEAASAHRDAAYYHNYQKGYSRNSQEGSTDEMVEKKGLTARIFETLREVFRTNDTSDSEVRADLNEMLREQGANGDVVDVYDGYFVYCLYTPTGMTYYRRDYTQDATGAVADIGTDVTEVEPKRSYEPVAASTTQPEPTAACGCHQQKEKDLMDLKTRVKALITASKGVYEDTDATMLEGYKPERLTALEAKFAEATPAAKTVEAPAAAVVVPAAVAAPAAKEPTFDELLAKADPDTRAAIESGRSAAAAKKTATIATLKASKRCDYTDDQLNAMPQADLDRLAKLASVTVATGTVDYSGQGAPRQGSQHQGAPAPIELKDALAAKSAAK